MDLRQFLLAVVTTELAKDDTAWFTLSHSNPDSTDWREEWFEWPSDIDNIIARVDELRTDFNVYFSAHLFSTQSTRREYVLPCRTIQADLDNAFIDSIRLPPSILVETSPDRHQGYWLIEDDQIPLADLEQASSKLTYSIVGCDKSGWSLGHRVRIPNSLNFKYGQPVPISIVSAPLHQYTIAELEALSPHQTTSFSEDTSTREWLDNIVIPSEMDGMGPYQYIETLKEKLPPKIYLQYDAVSSGGIGLDGSDKSRSAVLFALECTLFRLGLDKEHVLFLAYHSANNKFREARYNGNRDLGKDVLRAYAMAAAIAADNRDLVNSIKTARQQPHLKRQAITTLVLNQLRRDGEFVHTDEDLGWFIKHESGRPIILNHRSQYLDSLLDIQFMLNSTEQEQRYTVSALEAVANNMPVGVTTRRLSFYDRRSNSLLIHSGRSDIFRVTPTAIEHTTNGSFGVMFPWSQSMEPFTISAESLPHPWYELLFGESIGQIVEIPQPVTMALLRTWLIFVLLRNIATVRPILCLIGQPGSGKSTTFRKVFTLLYGRFKSLESVTTPDDFDMACATEALLVLDNVDVPERWLPDRLALAVTESDVIRRKLYSDSDTVVLHRRAMIGITTNTPSFGREDVADRMLIFNLERLTKFRPELDIIHDIVKYRSRIWYQIFQDIQTILATPLPEDSEIPQFRIEDFAKVGIWISRGLGIEEEFKTGIIGMQRNQQSFVTDDEHILLDALERAIKDYPLLDKTASDIWKLLELVATDSTSFKRRYRNAVVLGRKLQTLKEPLSGIVQIDWTRPLNGVAGTVKYNIAKVTT